MKRVDIGDLSLSAVVYLRVYEEGERERASGSYVRTYVGVGEIRIWPHRAGRVRSRHREMKFDRSDRRAAVPPAPPLLRPLHLSAEPRSPRRGPSAMRASLLGRFHESSRAVKWRCSHLRGAPRASSTSRLLSSPVASWGRTPHFIQFSFICHLPAAGYAPSGRSSSGPS